MYMYLYIYIYIYIYIYLGLGLALIPISVDVAGVHQTFCDLAIVEATEAEAVAAMSAAVAAVGSPSPAHGPPLCTSLAVCRGILPHLTPAAAAASLCLLPRVLSVLVGPPPAIPGISSGGGLLPGGISSGGGLLPGGISSGGTLPPAGIEPGGPGVISTEAARLAAAPLRNLAGA